MGRYGEIWGDLPLLGPESCSRPESGCWSYPSYTAIPWYHTSRVSNPMWVQSGGWCGIGRRLIAEEARRHVLPQLATRRLVRVARHGGRTYMNAAASGRECGLSRGTPSTLCDYEGYDRSVSAAEYSGIRVSTAESVSSRALVGAQARVFRFWARDMGRYGEIWGDIPRLGRGAREGDRGAVAAGDDGGDGKVGAAPLGEGRVRKGVPTGRASDVSRTCPSSRRKVVRLCACLRDVPRTCHGRAPPLDREGRQALRVGQRPPT